MIKKGVVVNFITPNQEVGGWGKFFSILGSLLSFLPIVFILWLMFGTFKGMGGDKKNQGGGMFGGGGPFSFGKNKARMIKPEDLKVTFADVAGIDEAKEDLMEMVDFLKDPQKYQEIGGRIPKGCLLVGSPGTGKTLLAKAIAAEANAPFFFISGSDFVEMFVGVGASRVRDMFAQAKKSAPCIIFIDEIDAVGRHRGSGTGGGNDEREQTLNQLLVEMDGFEENNGVVVLAATNRPDVLDSALLRPGRFDRQIVVSLPDLEGREQILNVHLKKIKFLPSIDIKTIAKGTPGFSGAELANLVNEAALMAARQGDIIVSMKHFEDSKDKIIMGSARRTVMKEEEKKLTAYHEGGHALIASLMPDSDPIHKATIIPRGRALGMVVRLPDGDRFSMTRAKMYADIAVGLAGRAAEELIFGYDKVTSGASSDIEMVTKLARAMVMEWGISDKVGTIKYTNDNEYGKKQHYVSEEMSRIIDSEVKLIIDGSMQKVKDMLTQNVDKLHAIARALLELETLTGAEIQDVMDGKVVVRHTNQPTTEPINNKQSSSPLGAVANGDDVEK
jgi:cell division protease FtsH